MPAAAASINSFKILGDSFIWIEAGSRARNGVRYGARGDRTLILDDATAIVEQVPLVKSMSPNADGHTQVVYGGENWVTMFRGVTPVFLQIRRWNTRLGAFFTEADVDATAPVCVLGQTVVDNLFGQRGSHRQDSTRPQYAVQGGRCIASQRLFSDRTGSGRFYCDALHDSPKKNYWNVLARRHLFLAGFRRSNPGG